MKIGMVIGTFGTPNYIRLQLEAAKRLYHHVEVLVHDDHSDEQDAIKTACREYGARFATTGTRRAGWHNGDLRGIGTALEWSHAHGHDMLLKVSRSFLPLTDWTKSLVSLADANPSVNTFGRKTKDHMLPIRTECFAMRVEPWSPLSISFQRADGAAEVVVGVLGQRLGTPWMADWNFVSDDWEGPNGEYLWHRRSRPEDYHRQSVEWDMGLRVEDFAMNNWFGDGHVFHSPPKPPEKVGRLPIKAAETLEQLSRADAANRAKGVTERKCGGCTRNKK